MVVHLEEEGQSARSLPQASSVSIYDSRSTTLKTAVYIGWRLQIPRAAADSTRQARVTRLNCAMVSDELKPFTELSLRSQPPCSEQDRRELQQVPK